MAYGFTPSPVKAWDRATKKYSNTCDNIISPIKQTVGIIKPDIDDDRFANGILWILHMSEKFYYDNTLILVSMKKDNINELKKLISMNINQITMNFIRQNWSDIAELGRGTFGLVSKVHNHTVNSDIAVKYIKNCARHHSVYDILNVLRERNYILKAYQSPYMVRLLRSFSLNEFDGHFLCFDYCISDLLKFMDVLVSYTQSFIYDIMIQRQGLIIQEYQIISNSMRMDLVRLFLIYSFEMFSMLDYLAQCNIIHSDIKPNNIMISKDFHLKLGDFGLINDIQHMTDPGQLIYANEATDAIINRERQELTGGGTPGYRDIELCYDETLYDTPMFINRFRIPDDVTGLISNELHETDYMSDLWSMSITVLQLLCFGQLLVYNRLYMHRPRQFFDSEIISSTHTLTLFLFWYNQMYHYIFNTCFLEEFGPVFSYEFCSFLLDNFLIRSQRGGSYTKTKNVRVYDDIKLYRQFDITNLEKMRIFEHFNINSNSCLLFDMKEMFKYINLKNERTGVCVDRYFDKLKQFDRSEDDRNVKTLRPGMGLNMDE